MKKIGIIFALLIVVGGIFAYYYDKQTKTNEFMTYYNEVWVPTSAKEEEKINENADKLEELENDGKKKKVAALVKEEILPVVKQGLKRFQEVDPKNDEIKKMNELAIEEEKQGIKLFEIAIEYGEGDQHEAAVQKAGEKHQEKVEELTDHTQTLIEKYDLKKDVRNKIGNVSKVKPE